MHSAAAGVPSLSGDPTLAHTAPSTFAAAVLDTVMEQIANANVPAEIRPLLFDSKRVAPEKDSQHQLSIAKLEAEAIRGYSLV